MTLKDFRPTGSDIFAAFQVLMAWFFAVPQAMRMSVDVSGVTINWLLCAMIFTGLSLATSAASYRRKPARTTLHALIIYSNWMILLIPIVTIAFAKCPWTRQDTLIFSMIMILAATTIVCGNSLGRNITDPAIRGILIGVFRVVPHLFMAYCIFIARSGHGIAGKTVFAANITALSRIITLYHSGRKSNRESGLRALLIAECANEASWMVTTLLWCIFL